MTEMAEHSEVETTAGKENGKPSRLILKSGLVLLATGALLAAGAKLRSKIDFAGMRKRMLSGKWLLSPPEEEAVAEDEQQQADMFASLRESDASVIASAK